MEKVGRGIALFLKLVCVLVINETVDFAKKSKSECLIFKVDFEKAYDSVDWGFLVYMMERVGMCSKWIAWMKAC